MKLKGCGVFLLFVSCCFSGISNAEERDSVVDDLKKLAPVVGSWTFSGTVADEHGDHYGYFFQMQKQGTKFHAKSALIDASTNKMVFFYEGDETIEQPHALDWNVARSFIRYNPINDSWVFGVKDKDKKGFNFKVDMLDQAKDAKDTMTLRPGVQLQTLQTSHLNGHINLDQGQEQFVTGNKAWFGTLVFSKEDHRSHQIQSTFCRLNNDDGFYSVHLKEEDATRGFVAGFRDAAGKRVKMSQFLAIKSMPSEQVLLSLSWPKMHLTMQNSLKHEDRGDPSQAGFTKSKTSDFCYITDQSFKDLG